MRQHRVAYLPGDGEDAALEATLAELEWWARVLRAGRESLPVPA